MFCLGILISERRKDWGEMECFFKWEGRGGRFEALLVAHKAYWGLWLERL